MLDVSSQNAAEFRSRNVNADYDVVGKMVVE